MRKIQENIEVYHSVTMAATKNEEIALPSLGDRVAYIAKDVVLQLNAGAGAAPTSVAAGLYSINIGLAGKDQAIPDDLALAEKLIRAYAGWGTAAGAGSAVSQNLSNGEFRQMVRPVLFRELFVLCVLTNIATFPAWRFSILVDAYQLTTSEFVDLLD